MTTLLELLATWRQPAIIAAESEARRREMRCWCDLVLLAEDRARRTAMDGRQVFHLDVFRPLLNTLLAALVHGRATITQDQAEQVAERAIEELERIRGGEVEE